MAAIAAATATVMLQPSPFFVVSFVVSFPASSSIFTSAGIETRKSLRKIRRRRGSLVTGPWIPQSAVEGAKRSSWSFSTSMNLNIGQDTRAGKDHLRFVSRKNW